MKLTIVLFALLFITINSVSEAQVPTTGLVLWERSDTLTASVTTNGTGVPYWGDLSGHSYDFTQNTLAIRPTYATNVYKSYPAIKFDSSSYYLSPGGTPSVLGMRNSDYEIFIVAQTSNSTAQQYLLAGHSTSQYELHINGSSGARFTPTTGVNLDEGLNGNFAGGQPNIYDINASSTSGSITVNGIAGGSTTSSAESSDSTTLYLGMRSDGSHPLYGYLFEVIIYDTLLSSSNRTTVENYLENRYGVSNRAYTVNGTADADTGSGRHGTLRYILNTINSFAPTDTATINMTGISGTITLTSDLPALNYDMIINGPGRSSLTISGNDLYRPFFIGDGLTPFSQSSPAAPNITINNFTVSHGKGLGGNGINGAGGAAGMGGAIFLNQGTLIIDTVTFDSNAAVGGTGPAVNFFTSGPGDGGGFGTSGNGGYLGGGVGATGLNDGNNYNGTANGGTGGVGGGGGAAYGATAGQGGFAGGGGSAQLDGYGNFGTGGKGGFGGGAGAGVNNGNTSGFGGGASSGGGNSQGGGGAGMGGAIFNYNGTLKIYTAVFDSNSTTGGGGAQAGTTYGGAIFNYGGSYLLTNVTYGTSGSANSADSGSNQYIYSGTALAVELTTFTGALQGNKVLLKWKTETEVNNYGFDIQRALLRTSFGTNRDQNPNWEKIGFVKGNGNSNSPKEYTFVDKDPAGGNNFEYRLKQIDLDGKYDYSKVVDVKMIPGTYALYQNYPNPFNPSTTINYILPYKSKVRLTLYNILGQQIKVLVNSVQSAGYYKFKWNAGEMASGIYIYVLKANLTAGQAGATYGQKSYRSMKKMILLK